MCTPALVFDATHRHQGAETISRRLLMLRAYITSDLGRCLTRSLNQLTTDVFAPRPTFAEQNGSSRGASPLVRFRWSSVNGEHRMPDLICFMHTTPHFQHLQHAFTLFSLLRHQVSINHRPLLLSYRPHKPRLAQIERMESIIGADAWPDCKCLVHTSPQH